MKRRCGISECSPFLKRHYLRRRKRIAAGTAKKEAMNQPVMATGTSYRRKVSPAAPARIRYPENIRKPRFFQVSFCEIKKTPDAKAMIPSTGTKEATGFPGLFARITVMIPSISEKVARAINPKFRGISFFRK
jgi:hypothetical protein